jgi:hypothetical protein
MGKLLKLIAKRIGIRELDTLLEPYADSADEMVMLVLNVAVRLTAILGVISVVGGLLILADQPSVQDALIGVGMMFGGVTTPLMMMFGRWLIRRVIRLEQAGRLGESLLEMLRNIWSERSTAHG